MFLSPVVLKRPLMSLIPLSKPYWYKRKRSRNIGRKSSLNKWYYCHLELVGYHQAKLKGNIQTNRKLLIFHKIEIHYITRFSNTNGME